MNQEGMDDRYYFSDWGGCICTEDGVDPDCPLFVDELHGEEEDDDE